MTGLHAMPRALRRRGLVSVAMLIGLIIVGIVAASLLKVASARREAARTTERRLQVDLLADSGLNRAVVRLAANPRYDGEVWDVAAADLGGRDAARITIRLEPDPAPSGGRRLVVAAECPAAGRHAIRRTRTVHLPNALSPR